MEGRTVRRVRRYERQRAPAKAATLLLSDVHIKPIGIPGSVRGRVGEVIGKGRRAWGGRIGNARTPNRAAISVRHVYNRDRAHIEAAGEGIIPIHRVERQDVDDAVEELQRTTGLIRGVRRVARCLE